MALDLQVLIEVSEHTHAGQARRRAHSMALNAGLSEQQANSAAIVASEAATNVVKHGSGGELLLRQVPSGIEVIAVDKGKGISDISRSLSDGVSSTGTSGTGLGAIRRLSSLFDIYSQRNGGTAILSRIENGSAVVTSKNFGVVCRPKHGETLCGDAWGVKEAGDQFWVVVADGLGHGPEAHEASMEATRIFRETSGHKSTTDLLEVMHGVLRKTRGAAVAAARIDRAAGELRFSGVGNIAATVLTRSSWKSMMSHNGILGHEVRRMQEFSVPWTPGSKLVMNSDGLSTWNLDPYPGLFAHQPAVMAGVLYRDFWRRRDDVTVLVVQEKPRA